MVRTRLAIDPSVVRGLEYYTGPVYEAELTFEVPNEQGQPVRFGSVAGGGRYDGLVGRFRSEPVPATGFSIGVSRLLAALKAVNSPLLTAQKPLPLVVVTAMDAERIGDYQRMVAQLRSLRDGDGKPLLRAEMYLGEGRFGAQLKYADRRGALCAVIQGSSEKDEGKVQIKDLKVGAELAAIAKNDREAYLQKQAEAQFSVPEDELVDAVRKVLARHVRVRAEAGRGSPWHVRIPLPLAGRGRGGGRRVELGRFSARHGRRYNAPLPPPRSTPAPPTPLGLRPSRPSPQGGGKRALALLLRLRVRLHGLEQRVDIEVADVLVRPGDDRRLDWRSRRHGWR